MITGKVIGHLVSTINDPFYDHKKIMIVEKTDESGNASGGYIVAVDAVDAGIGQDVLILDEGNGSRQVWNSSTGAVRSTIVGIIDSVDVDPGA